MQVKFKLVPGSTKVVLYDTNLACGISPCPPLLGGSSSGVALKLLQLLNRTENPKLLIKAEVLQCSLKIPKPLLKLHSNLQM